MNQLSLKKENDMIYSLCNIKTLAEFNSFIDKSKVEDWPLVNIKDNDIKELSFMRQLTHPHWGEAMKSFEEAKIMYGKFVYYLLRVLMLLLISHILLDINTSRSS